MTLEFELKSNGHPVTRFEANRLSTDTICAGSPERELGHYEWIAWRGKLAIGSGELNHYVDMGIEYLAWLILQDFWEDQISRLMTEHRRLMDTIRPMTRYEAEQEIARGTADLR